MLSVIFYIYIIEYKKMQHSETAVNDFFEKTKCLEINFGNLSSSRVLNLSGLFVAVSEVKFGQVSRARVRFC